MIQAFLFPSWHILSYHIISYIRGQTNVRIVTIKPLLYKRRCRPDNTYFVTVRVRHGNQTREIGTGYKVHEKNWNGSQVVKHEHAAKINARISEITNQAMNYFSDCQRHNKRFRIEMIGRQRTSESFSEYILHRAAQYEKKQMLVMAIKARRIEKELRAHLGREVYFDQLNQDLLREYDSYLVGIGNAQNTRHKKFKFLQQFYSQATLDGKAEDPNPFKLYKINPKPVQKEKLTEADIKAIEELPLKPGPVNDARNLFLFSYYSKGARFENCIMFQRKQIVKDRLIFKTNKGNKFISVQLHKRLKKILDQYKGKDFVFPYVKEIPEDKRQYIKLIDVYNVIVNRNLKVVAALAEIKPFTFHQARHSFAYHLKKVASSIGVIADSLGHSNTRTTEIYLKALDDEFLDKEIQKVYGK
jgi:integrase